MINTKKFFDSYFYSICNPDVLNSNLNPRDHFTDFKSVEDRVYDKKYCNKRLITNDNYEYQDIKNTLILNQIHLRNRSKLLCYDLPWHLGSHGFPNKVFEITNLGRINLPLKLEPVNYII
jgi:hypothetical protein